mmetsp:Transcript_16635/g.49758  ORF Transcript_16635/g.49758 Transcript_16635/m.49758 type:complete len:289 (+) Transcript_16635:677-1543(+)
MAGSSSTTRATPTISAKSREMARPTPGCLTLTATWVPAGSPVWEAPWGDRRARCTCPMLPLARGSRSKDMNRSSTGAPSEVATAASVCLYACAGAALCRCASSWQKSGGNTSARVAAHWPHLMKAGPATSSVFLNTNSQSGRQTWCCRASDAVSATGENSIVRNSSRSRLDTACTAVWNACTAADLFTSTAVSLWSYTEGPGSTLASLSFLRNSTIMSGSSLCTWLPEHLHDTMTGRRKSRANPENGSMRDASCSFFHTWLALVPHVDATCWAPWATVPWPATLMCRI